MASILSVRADRLSLAAFRTEGPPFTLVVTTSRHRILTEFGSPPALLQHGAAESPSVYVEGSPLGVRRRHDLSVYGRSFVLVTRFRRGRQRTSVLANH